MEISAEWKGKIQKKEYEVLLDLYCRNVRHMGEFRSENRIIRSKATFFARKSCIYSCILTVLLLNVVFYEIFITGLSLKLFGQFIQEIIYLY